MLTCGYCENFEALHTSNHAKHISVIHFYGLFGRWWGRVSYPVTSGEPHSQSKQATHAGPQTTPLTPLAARALATEPWDGWRPKPAAAECKPSQPGAPPKTPPGAD